MRLNGRQFVRAGIASSIFCAVALAAACSDGGGSSGDANVEFDEEAACASSISGGDTAVSSSCLGCTVTNEGAAIDGNPDTFALYEVPPATSNTVRADAQNGVVFPSGVNAGLFGRIVQPATSGYSLTTYLNGQVQESSSNNLVSSSEDKVQLTFVAQVEFDSLEVVFDTQSNASEVEIHSFCAHESQ